jgi:hypothetical protein
LRTSKDHTTSPGPGGYNPKNSFKYDGHTVFGGSKRQGIFSEKHAKFVPSPFAYN